MSVRFYKVKNIVTVISVSVGILILNGCSSASRIDVKKSSPSSEKILFSPESNNDLNKVFGEGINTLIDRLLSLNE